MTAIVAGAGIILALLALRKQRSTVALRQDRSLIVQGPPVESVEAPSARPASGKVFGR